MSGAEEAEARRFATWLATSDLSDAAAKDRDLRLLLFGNFVTHLRAVELRVSQATRPEREEAWRAWTSWLATSGLRDAAANDNKLYCQLYKNFVHEAASKIRTLERTALIKRELVEVTWHPSRLTTWCLAPDDWF